MKKSIMKKWVAALRSGKYKQSTGGLRRGDNAENGAGFCCLGVLCAIRPGTKWYKKDGGDYILKLKSGMHPASSGMLPNIIKAWAGMKTLSGMREEGSALWSLNDSSRQSFNQIADVIEKEWETL